MTTHTSKWSNRGETLQISQPGPTPYSGDMWLHDCGIAHYRHSIGRSKTGPQMTRATSTEPMSLNSTQVELVHEHCTSQANQFAQVQICFSPFLCFPSNIFHAPMTTQCHGQNILNNSWSLVVKLPKIKYFRSSKAKHTFSKCLWFLLLQKPDFIYGDNGFGSMSTVVIHRFRHS